MWTPPDTPAFLRKVSDSFYAGNPLYSAIALALLFVLIGGMALSMLRAHKKRERRPHHLQNFTGLVTIQGIGAEFARPLRVNKDTTVDVAVMRTVTCRLENESDMRVDLPYSQWGMLKRGDYGLLEAKDSRVVSFTARPAPPSK